MARPGRPPPTRRCRSSWEPRRTGLAEGAFRPRRAEAGRFAHIHAAPGRRFRLHGLRGGGRWRTATSATTPPSSLCGSTPTRSAWSTSKVSSATSTSTSKSGWRTTPTWRSSPMVRRVNPEGRRRAAGKDVLTAERLKLHRRGHPRRHGGQVPVAGGVPATAALAGREEPLAAGAGRVQIVRARAASATRRWPTRCRWCSPTEGCRRVKNRSTCS